MVGDIVRLSAGDKVPTDGILVDGSDVACNESALTGEPDEKAKTTKSILDGGDPFLLSGSTVSSGYGRMLVTAVGEQSRWGKTKAKLAVEAGDTPLQEKLDKLAGQIGRGGMSAALLTFIAMIVLWCIHPEWRDPHHTFFEFVLKAFIMAVTIVVVAVPEGLPLAVTLSLAYSTQKMMLDNNLIRVLAACETMGNATNICSDKTGTLTQNRMTVVEGWFAGKFFDRAPCAEDLDSRVINYLSEGIAINTTAALLYAPGAPKGAPEVYGNKTEGALLIMMVDNFNVDYTHRRAEGFKVKRGDKLMTFSSARKRMSVIQNLESGCRVYSKGAAEVMVDLCSSYTTSNGSAKPLDKKTKAEVLERIESMGHRALRALALCHRDMPKSCLNDPPEKIEVDFVLDAVVGIKVRFTHIAWCYYCSVISIMISFVVIIYIFVMHTNSYIVVQDPLRPDVAEAVNICQEAGIFVRMVTGDNIDTAKAIARECGILTDGGVAMEGPEFRKLTNAQLDAILPSLQVTIIFRS